MSASFPNNGLVPHPSDGAGRLRLVAGQLAGEFGPTVTGRDPNACQKLIDRMRVVKRARFNAAERLEAKGRASHFSLAVVALYFFGLAVWQAIYGDDLSAQTNKLVTSVEIVSSVFTLVLGLLEAMSDHRLKSYQLHKCALAVNNLAQELEISRPSDQELLQSYRERYNRIVTDSPNHQRLDYFLAKVIDTTPWTQWFPVYCRYYLSVYGFYAVLLVVPPALLMTLWSG